MVNRLVLGIGLIVGVLTGTATGQQLQQKDFGTTLEGNRVHQYILTNNKGASVRIIDYGAIVTNLFVPDKNGTMGDVVLGFDDVKEYEEVGPFIGCIAGRYANRIANGMF